MSLSSQMMGRDHPSLRATARQAERVPPRRRSHPPKAACILEWPKIIRDLNSFVSRLSRRYLAAQLSMSLVPVAPFSTPLGMTRGR